MERRIKLGDAVEFFKRRKMDRNQIRNYGMYNVYPCNKFSDNYNYSDESIILEKFGNNRIYYTTQNERYNIKNNFHVFHFKSKREDIKTEFIYVYLKMNPNLIYRMRRGQTFQTINNQNFKNIKIKYYSLDVQERLIKEFRGLSDNFRNYLFN